MTETEFKRLSALNRTRNRAKENYPGEKVGLIVKAEEHIANIPDPILREYMQLRYIDGLSFERISGKTTHWITDPDTIRKSIARYIRTLGK